MTGLDAFEAVVRVVVPWPERLFVEMNLPVIAVTMGDPAGVGPELALDIVSKQPSELGCIPIVFGDSKVLQAVASHLNTKSSFTSVDLAEWKAGNSPTKFPSVVNVPSIQLSDFEPGEVNAATGQASYDYLNSAIDECLADRVDGITTCPINKEALHFAGINFPGHTEILGDRTKTDRFCMMLTSEEITCSLVTTHIGLSQVSQSLNKERIEQVILLSYEAIKRIRNREPRLVVCGLNPHAGEHGLFGNQEEETIILPAIEAAKQQRIEIVGPLPADTAFTKKLREQTDCYICMYHDQGLIPLKTLAFDTAVNVTLGLPIVRTSVDHGTALDIAWTGKVDPSNLVCALKLAASLARSR